VPDEDDAAGFMMGCKSGVKTSGDEKYVRLIEYSFV